MNVKLIKRLFEINAIKFGKFKLKSGEESDFYVDGRQAALDYVSLEMMVDGFEWLLDGNIDFDCIGCDDGPAPNTILGPLLLRLNKQGFVVRKAVKDHGLSDPIVGKAGNRPVLIEDVITSGGSLLNIINKLTVKPIAVLTIVDRQEGGKEVIENLGIKFYSLLTKSQIISWKENEF